MTLTFHPHETTRERLDKAAYYVTETARLYVLGAADRQQLARALDEYDTVRLDLAAGFDRPLHADGTPCFGEFCEPDCHPTGVRP